MDRSPERVKDHDFRSEAEGLAIPYGIYDPRANAGTVFVARWTAAVGAWITSSSSGSGGR